MKKIITYILYTISLSSLFLATGVKEVANWWDIARPLLLICFITGAIAFAMSNADNIRRVVYPAFVCVCAWIYEHKIIRTKFTQDAYRVYKWQNKSYFDLYIYAQDLFDSMCI